MFNAYIPIFVLQYYLTTSFGLIWSIFVFFFVFFVFFAFWPTHSYERYSDLISFSSLVDEASVSSKRDPGTRLHKTLWKSKLGK